MICVDSRPGHLHFYLLLDVTVAFRSPERSSFCSFLICVLSCLITYVVCSFVRSLLACLLLVRLNGLVGSVCIYVETGQMFLLWRLKSCSSQKQKPLCEICARPVHHVFCGFWNSAGGPPTKYVGLFCKVVYAVGPLIVMCLWNFKIAASEPPIKYLGVCKVVCAHLMTTTWS